MFLLYLRRELLNRKRQSVVVALGLGLAVALVVVVSGLSAGVDRAQSEVLGSLYGIGTDITVTRSAVPGQGGGPQRFGVEGGATGGEARRFSRSQVRVERGARTFSAGELSSVRAVAGVSDAAGALRLSSITFDGELPDFTQIPADGGPQTTPGTGAVPGGDGAPRGPGGGGFRMGNADFSIISVGLMGVDLSHPEAGPLSSTKVLAGGRALTAADAGTDVAVADSAYAAGQSLAVGDAVTIGERTFTLVGLIAPAAEASETATDLYIPLDVAQGLAELGDEVTNLYVTTVSGDETDAVAESLRSALPDATVNTAEQLGESVSGSLSTASNLIGNLGRWLSILVLAASFLGAILLTTSGVTRRTREFGTLRALGWKKGRIVGQVAGESVVQGLLGGAIGAGVGLFGARVVTALAPSLEATAASNSPFPGGFRGGAGPFGGGGAVGATASSLPNGGGRVFGGPGGFAGLGAGQTFEVALRTVVTPGVIVTAVALALLGGILAGAFGGLRASRLRPADALRSVA